MIISMTGFGTATLENEHIRVVAEIKSLNSKFLDVSFRFPRNFSGEKELEIRNSLKDRLQRGKVSASLDFRFKDASLLEATIQSNLLKSYYKQLKNIAEELEADSQDIFRIASLMPDVTLQENGSAEYTEEDWEIIKQVFEQALLHCEKFRIREGEGLEKEFIGCIQKIDALLVLVHQQDPKRIENIKEKIQNKLVDIASNEMFDHNRFEQEMIYFIEKLDIAEEKVRLKQHLDYFLQSIHIPEPSGKKLGFIAQEIGREINTIGSKANDAVIQKLVVEMKEELEKIKEQLSNIL